MSMVASRLTSQNKELDANTVFPINDDTSLLTSAAVYGANASGKSNLVAAMRFMRDFVLSSSKDTQAGEPIPVEVYALSPETQSQPASFEMVFIAEGTQYRYGFAVTPERIEREWLYYVPKTREVQLFERERDAIKLAKDSFAEGDGLQAKTRSNALFISVVAQFNGTVAARILTWFREYAIISGLDDDHVRSHTVSMLWEPERAHEVIEFIKTLDVGIDDVTLDETAVYENYFGRNRAWMIGYSASIAREQDALYLSSSNRLKIMTIHKNYTVAGELDSPVLFNLDSQESEGTKKLFALAGQLIETLRYGNPLIIDEFDARLHPLITREIIRLFNSKETNPKHAQLIFMTHDTNLLDKDFLRRDQIWFTEKDRYGASHLYSLAEFKVRNDASYGKDYIQGKYGAIPFLGDLRRVVEIVN